MGINLKDLVRPKPISVDALSGKKIAVDAYNILYQFLTAIRDRSGEPFRDTKGRVTSHIMGLFYRVANLIEAGAKPVFVFDGKPVVLKHGTCSERAEIRATAAKRFEEAKAKGDIFAAQKYGKQASKLTPEMVADAKKLLVNLGLPVVQAPHDGEAQAAWMCREGHVDAVVSQDWDCLLFGAPLLVRNLTTGANSEPQEVVLKEVLGALELTREQLVEAAVLIGTDFNAGVKGIGPKTAIKLAREGKLAEHADRIEHFDEIKQLFLAPEVNKEFTLEWKPANREASTLFLSERGFSDARIKKTLERIAPKQKGLSEFF